MAAACLLTHHQSLRLIVRLLNVATTGKSPKEMPMSNSGQWPINSELFLNCAKCMKTEDRQTLRLVMVDKKKFEKKTVISLSIFDSHKYWTPLSRRERYLYRTGIYILGSKDIDDGEVITDFDIAHTDRISVVISIGLFISILYIELTTFNIISVTCRYIDTVHRYCNTLPWYYYWQIPPIVNFHEECSHSLWQSMERVYVTMIRT